MFVPSARFLVELCHYYPNLMLYFRFENPQPSADVLTQFYGCVDFPDFKEGQDHELRIIHLLLTSERDVLLEKINEN